MKTNSHFFLLVCRYMAEHWKRHALLTLIIALILYIAFSLSGVISQSLDALATGFADFQSLAAVITMLLFSIAYHSAHSMPSLATRTSSIAHYVLPASPCSKYSAAVFSGTVIPLVQTIVAALLADAVHALRSGSWALKALFTSHLWTELSITVKDIPGTSTLVAMSIFFGFAYIAFTSGWYSLSATIFRRHPFLLGTIISIFASQIFSVAVTPVLMRLSADWQTLSTSAAVGNISKVLLIVSVIHLVLALALHVIAYHRSKRIEL